MLALLALLPARALDLEVAYTTTFAQGGPSVPEEERAVEYARSWTFHDVDVTPPPDVLVECPDGQTCRLVTEVTVLEGDKVTIAFSLQRMEVSRREIRWTDVLTPRVTTRIAQPASIEQGARIPIMVDDAVQFQHRVLRLEAVPLD